MLALKHQRNRRPGKFVEPLKERAQKELAVVAVFEQLGCDTRSGTSVGNRHNDLYGRILLSCTVGNQREQIGIVIDVIGQRENTNIVVCRRIIDLSTNDNAHNLTVVAARVAGS